MQIEQKLQEEVAAAMQQLFSTQIAPDQVQITLTDANFDGDRTVVVFPLAGRARKSPAEVAEQLGNFLQEQVSEISAFNIVKGYLNVSFSNAFWMEKFNTIKSTEAFGTAAPTGITKMVEYSSPNTNKPLHLGHLRNIFLGWSVAEILKACGHEVVKVQIINDRGIHICMSMLAYQKWGKGEQPSAELKGDHLVGKYYVLFNTELKKQTQALLEQYQGGDYTGLVTDMAEKFATLQNKLPELEATAQTAKTALNNFLAEQGVEEAKALKGEAKKEAKPLQKEARSSVAKIQEAEVALQDIAKKSTPILQEAREMLLQWEAKDAAVYALWEKMNGWVYAGFDATYNQMGVSFDKLYFESDTYLTGKEHVQDGLDKGIFYQKEDGSIWCDLTDRGMDHKLLLRSDGTAVYMTQDIGTAILRFEDYPALQQLIYTVGNEQEYHFRALFHILDKLGLPWAKECRHLSYGMVELPHGKMKSREGTVVDADNLMHEVIYQAELKTQDSGKLDRVPKAEHPELFRKIGLGAVKYYLLHVDPVRGMKYDPEASVELNGDTGPYLQYQYARVASLRRNYAAKYNEPVQVNTYDLFLGKSDIELIGTIARFPAVVQDAGAAIDPSIITSYTRELAVTMSAYYHENPILKDVTREVCDFRMELVDAGGKVLESALRLLGIEVPELM